MREILLFFLDVHACNFCWSFLGIFSRLLFLIELFVVCSGLVSDLFTIFIHLILFLLLFLLLSQDDDLFDELIIGVVLWELMLKIIECKLCFGVNFDVFVQLQQRASVGKDAFKTFDCIISSTIGTLDISGSLLNLFDNFICLCILRRICK
jgi:hypothetical protein